MGTHDDESPKTPDPATLFTVRDGQISLSPPAGVRPLVLYGFCRPSLGFRHSVHSVEATASSPRPIPRTDGGNFQLIRLGRLLPERAPFPQACGSHPWGSVPRFRMQS